MIYRVFRNSITIGSAVTVASCLLFPIPSIASPWLRNKPTDLNQSQKRIFGGELEVNADQETEPKLELEPDLFKNYTDSPDVKIVVTDSTGAQTSLKAHRALLEKYEYFKTALSEKWQGRSEVYIEFEGADPFAIKDVLSYLYRGEFRLAPDSKVVEIYQALDFLLLPDAGEKLREYFILSDYFDTLGPKDFALHLTAVASLPEGSELKAWLEPILFGYVALRSTDLQTLPFYFEKDDPLTTRIDESLQLGPKKFSSLIALGQEKFLLNSAIYKKEAVRILEERLDEEIKKAVRRNNQKIDFWVRVPVESDAKHIGRDDAVKTLDSKYRLFFRSWSISLLKHYDGTTSVSIKAQLF